MLTCGVLSPFLFVMQDFPFFLFGDILYCEKWCTVPFSEYMRFEEVIPLIKEELSIAHDAFAARDTRELNPLQMAYVGDTVHDLYVRSMLLSRGMTVGKMH